MQHKSRAGFTLVESIISFAVLISAFAVVFQLFHTALRYSADFEVRGQALILAQTYLAKMKAEANDIRAFSAGLPAFNGQVFSESVFQIETFVTAQTEGPLASPSRALEETFRGTPDDRILLTNSSYLAEVRVSWQSGTGTRDVRLLGLLTEPVREGLTVSISPTTVSPLAQDAEQEFTVTATDADGPVEGLSFVWAVVPATSNGRLERTSRDGRSATFKHRLPALYAYPSGFAAPGTCRVQVRTRCEGIDYTDELEVELR